MNVDIKHDFFKSILSESKLSHKNINSTIEQSLVSSTAQKSLNMDLKNNDEADRLKKELEKKKKKALEKIGSKAQREYDSKIVRDPMKLLYVL